MSEQKKFVVASFEIDCRDNRPLPIYRIWLGDQLFGERCFDFWELWLQECLQILAPPGDYTLRVEGVNKDISQFKLWNFQVEKGPAVFHPREDHNSNEIILEIQ